jgi:hypothetical protein
MDDAIVELLEGLGLEESGFGLGTPDLAAASKFVADEYQHRAAILSPSDAGRRRCGGQREPTRRQRSPREHC